MIRILICWKTKKGMKVMHDWSRLNGDWMGSHSVSMKHSFHPHARCICRENRTLLSTCEHQLTLLATYHHEFHSTGKAGRYESRVFRMFTMFTVLRMLRILRMGAIEMPTAHRHVTQHLSRLTTVKPTGSHYIDSTLFAASCLSHQFLWEF